MIDVGMILKELREIYNAGSTQQEIADRTGVSQSYVADLLSGKRPIDGLTLKKFNQLFPSATLSFGNRSIGNNNVIRNARVQSDNNFLPGRESSSEEFRRILIDTIISNEEISDEERGKFLRIIKGVGK